MLICPEDGDCLLIPEEYRRPDIAVVTSDSIINVTSISPTALIVSAAEGDAGRAEAVLGYRGMQNLFTTEEKGCIIITESGQGILVDQQ